MLSEALDRTLLLMRDEFGNNVSDDQILAALTGTSIALIADEANIASHSAQTAFITSAILMARSGHRVYLVAPSATLVGHQPPLQPGRLIDQLLLVGRDLLPGIELSAEIPKEKVDLAVALGDSALPVQARRTIRLNADRWSGTIAGEIDPLRWNAGRWPLGAMAAAALAGTEAFKIAVRKLGDFARIPERMTTVFADTEEITFHLAPPNTPCQSDLGWFDCISGGAITNALLFVLSRIPELTGRARVIEPESSDLSNLNRYMLLLRSHINSLKGEDLAEVCRHTGLHIDPITMRYAPAVLGAIAPLAPSVLVGVDDIPTRWAVQQADPDWLGIGATTHWSAMASFHRIGVGCAQCLHPTDDPNQAHIPTVAFVSFWAGLLTAAYFLRHAGGEAIPLAEQQVYLTPSRSESPTRALVHIRAACPTCSAALQLDSTPGCTGVRVARVT